MNAHRSVKRIVQLLICLAILIGTAQTGPSQIAPAGKYTFTAIDVSGARETRLSGINDKGQIVGQYLNSELELVGLLVSDGVFWTKRFGTVETGISGINRLGDIVGYSWDGEGYAMQGFLVHDDVRTTINPGGGASLANGINDKGSIVGESNEDGSTALVASGGGSTAFVYSDGVYTPIVSGNPTPATALGINNKGQIVGEAGSSGYLLENDRLILLDFPGAARTAAIGINNGGDIVGVYYMSASECAHGFLFSNGMFSPIDVTGATETVPTDINNHGQIVGRYKDTENKVHGFLAEPQKGRR